MYFSIFMITISCKGDFYQDYIIRFKSFIQVVKIFKMIARLSKEIEVVE
jgi:hypothetical protein